MGKNYPMRIYTDESVEVIEWIAEYPDLPGCIGVGDTMEEALAEAESNKKLWIEAAKKMGADVPEPSEIFSNDFSGKFNIRLPKFLHKALALKADEEDTSLNQLCLAYLSMGLAKCDRSAHLSLTGYDVRLMPPQTVAEKA